MAKSKDKGESLGAYFRRVLLENPDWIASKSNSLIKERFEEDHAGSEFTSSIRANMANIKSQLRKSLPGRREKAARARSSGNADLEGLEVAIDHCLYLARTLDPEGLDLVIRSLRHARNQLVWKLGEP